MPDSTARRSISAPTPTSIRPWRSSSTRWSRRWPGVQWQVPEGHGAARPRSDAAQAVVRQGAVPSAMACRAAVPRDGRVHGRLVSRLARKARFDASQCANAQIDRYTALAAQRDIAWSTPHERRPIEGVMLTTLRQITDERGAVLHMLRADAPGFRGFGECYFSEIRPGVRQGLETPSAGRRRIWRCRSAACAS